MNRIVRLLVFSLCLGGLTLMAAAPKVGQKKRIYIGFKIPQSVNIGNVRTYIINQLKTKNPQLQYTVNAPHMTVSFIGEVDENELDKVQQAIICAVQEFKKQYGAKSLSGITIEKEAYLFGQQNNIIVLKAQVPDALGSLKILLDTTLKQSGITVSPGQFIPHITLARIQSTFDKSYAQAILKTVNPPIGSRAHKQESFAFDKLYLFQSPDTVLASFDL